MDEKKNNDKGKHDKRKPRILNEGITFITCPIHNFSYPQGATCSKCDAESKKNK